MEEKSEVTKAANCAALYPVVAGSISADEVVCTDGTRRHGAAAQLHD